jgi:hypothetical protein
MERAQSTRPYVVTKASPPGGPGRRVLHILRRDSILDDAYNGLVRLGIDSVERQRP